MSANKLIPKQVRNASSLRPIDPAILLQQRIQFLLRKAPEHAAVHSKRQTHQVVDICPEGVAELFKILPLFSAASGLRFVGKNTTFPLGISDKSMGECEANTK